MFHGKCGSVATRSDADPQRRAAAAQRPTQDAGARSCTSGEGTPQSSASTLKGLMEETYYTSVYVRLSAARHRADNRARRTNRLFCRRQRTNDSSCTLRCEITLADGHIFRPAHSSRLTLSCFKPWVTLKENEAPEASQSEAYLCRVPAPYILLATSHMVVC